MDLFLLNETKLKFVSLNVRGIRSYFKRTKIFSWLEQQRGDGTFLQETFSLEGDVNEWMQQWKGKIVFSHGTSHSCGVMILFKPGLDYDIITQISSDEGRFILLKVKLDGNEYNLCNVYAPTSDKHLDQLYFYNKLHETLITMGNIQTHPTIIGGDWNTLLNRNLDRDGGNPGRPNDVNDTIGKIQNDLDVVDIWRLRNPITRRYTWRQLHPLIQSRLDIWFISDFLQDYVRETDIIPGVDTDHSAIVLDIEFKPTKRPKAMNWKFNNSLCEDEHFCAELSRNLDGWITEGSQFVDLRMKWEFIKYQIRSFSRKYSINKARKLREEKQKLEKELCRLQKLIDEQGNSFVNEYEKAKLDYETHLNYITHGIIVRSRANWVEYGEKNSKFFLNLEKVNKARTCIYKLKDKGVLLTNNQLINDSIKNFYSDLYKKPDIKDMSNCPFLKPNATPKLTLLERDMCDGELTFEECTAALYAMAKNKSPGNDGISVEFYCKFWDKLGPLLVETMNYSFREGELTTSQKQGVITLIAKKGKNKLFIENYRPITLLNVDLKIGSKALAMRLKNILPNIIHPDQVAFVKDRYIGEAVRTVIDTLFYSKIMNIYGSLISLDFKKAFDSLNHQFLSNVLKVFNFGPQFCNYIKVLYNDIESCVMNDNISTGYFKVGKGVRQGDPLSPYLFILAVETLAIHIRANPKIIGIKINEQDELKLSMYADDITIFISDNQCFSDVITTLNDFEMFSSLSLNYDKTKAMNIGPGEAYDIHRLNTKNIEFVRVITILGVDISYSFEDTNAQLQRILSNIKSQLNLWRARDLSLYGKIQIVKTFAISQVLYLTSMIAVPNSFIRDVNKVLYDFVWRGPDRVKREVLVKNYEEGGLKMPCLLSMIQAQKIRWVSRLFTSFSKGWRSICLELLRPAGKDFLFHCNFDVTKLTVRVSSWLLEVLKTWSILKSKDLNIPNQVIWHNKHILFDRKSVFKPRIKDKGFVKISDFLDEFGRPLRWRDCKDKGLQFTEYFTLLDCYKKMPRTWKYFFMQQNYHHLVKPLTVIPTVMIEGTLKEIHKTTTKQLYNFFVYLNNPGTSIVFDRLKNLYNIEPEEVNILFNLPARITIDSRLRITQYKIMNNLVATNAWLVRIGKQDDASCTFCNDASETIEHLFYYCPTVTRFWNAVFSQFNTMSFDPLPFKTREKILFGVTQPRNQHILLFNFIILLGKQFILKCKYQKLAPRLQHFINYITVYESTEEEIAKRKHKGHLHRIKWQKIHNIMEII